MPAAAAGVTAGAVLVTVGVVAGVVHVAGVISATDRLNAMGGGSARTRVKKLDGPEFGALTDHAGRHGNGLTPNAYYNQAVAHTGTGRAFRFYHNGMFKQGYVTRLSPNSFRFTSTNTSGNRIFTHMDVGAEYLRNIGISLPGGF